MFLLKIRISEQGRLRLCKILCALYFVKLLVSITVLAFGAHMKVSISRLKHVYIGYDDDTLPHLFIGVGLISILTNILTGLACFEAQHYDNRQKVSVVLRILSVLNFGLGVTLFAASILCFSHTSHLNDAFDRGLRQSMAEYAYNPKIKLVLDELQMEYKCCGNKGHEDWFKVGWILDKFNEPVPDLPRKQHILPQSYFYRDRRETAPELEGPASNQDSVPFSCCDPRTTRPCVHKDITNTVKHAHYDYTTHTLYKKGCTEVIMDYLGDTLLTGGGVFALTTFFIEVFLLVLTRYLQTSLRTAIDMGFFDLTSPGYLINCPCIVEKDPYGMESAYQQIQPDQYTDQTYPQDDQYYQQDPNYYDEPGFASDEFSEYAQEQEMTTYQPSFGETHDNWELPQESQHAEPSSYGSPQQSYTQGQTSQQMQGQPSYGAQQQSYPQVQSSRQMHVPSQQSYARPQSSQQIYEQTD